LGLKAWKGLPSAHTVLFSLAWYIVNTLKGPDGGRKVYFTKRHSSAGKDVSDAEKTIELVKEFEKEEGMHIETHESYKHLIFWEVTVWMTKIADFQWMTGKKDIPRAWGRISPPPQQKTKVLVVRNPQKSNAFAAESRGNWPHMMSL
jgi:hypothetical protein